MRPIFSFLLGILLLFIYLWAVRQREGFATGQTPTDVLSALKSANDTTYGNLNTSVYKKNYQDIVTELDRFADLSMLESISNSTQGMESIQSFNDLFQFKTNLYEFKSILTKMS